MTRSATFVATVSLVTLVVAHATAQRSSSHPATPAELRGAVAQPGEYRLTGMVLAADPIHRTLTISHDALGDIMDAMTMAFAVKGGKELDDIKPGALVAATLVVTRGTSYLREVRVTRYESIEQDPLSARRLALLKRMLAGETLARVAVGDPAPPFELIDQRRAPVTLASLAGKVVALNFVYTRCTLPQFCVRMSTAFSVLQRRFRDRLGRDFVLLTITIDPVRDRPEVLAEYARRWKADPSTWHFLTGDPAEVKHLANRFGVDAFPDEGLVNHSLRTIVIDREGRVAASIEGNRFTPEQLGDLVGAVLNR